jgi:hypothetical protein
VAKAKKRSKPGGTQHSGRGSRASGGRGTRRSAPKTASSAKFPIAAALAELPDDDLIDAVQRQTFRFFWEGAHPASGLAPDRRTLHDLPMKDTVAVGGSGFSFMAIIVAVERGWITREAAIERLLRMLDTLVKARCYHGALPHFMNGVTGETVPFTRRDDAADIMETALLVQGLLCARQYFTENTPAEDAIRVRILWLWEEVEWNWFTQGQNVLYWHWSPYNGWVMNHPIQGWNECLIAYVLAASSPRYSIDPEVYHQGYASGPGFLNGKSYHDIELPLGMPYGGPLFFTHYSFCGLDPHGLKDRYAHYWDLNTRHVRINRAYCTANPKGFKGYGKDCWGLTASDDPNGYLAHAPDNDNGTIAPTAALASLPYAPKEVMQALRYMLRTHGKHIWTPFGFVDAFNEQRNWFAQSFIAIDQGPIVVMMENHRTGLLWKLFMSVPEVQNGLRKLGFASPYLGNAE